MDSVLPCQNLDRASILLLSSSGISLLLVVQREFLSCPKNSILHRVVGYLKVRLLAMNAWISVNWCPSSSKSPLDVHLSWALWAQKTEQEAHRPQIRAECFAELNREKKTRLKTSPNSSPLKNPGTYWNVKQKTFIALGHRAAGSYACYYMRAREDQWPQGILPGLLLLFWKNMKWQHLGKWTETLKQDPT